MAMNILSATLVSGAFIALVCAVLVALRANAKVRQALAEKDKKIAELTLKVSN